ncbi:MAG: ferredoxin [Azoarcus sp.]|nr:ferredoxin [Azoarcus sp.]
MSRHDSTENPFATTLVEKPKLGSYRRHLLVCTGPRCSANSDPQALFDSLGEHFKRAGLDAGALRVKRTRASCFAACKGGPILCVQPDGVWYYNVTLENMQRIVDQHLVGGKVVTDLIFHQGPTLTA